MEDLYTVEQYDSQFCGGRGGYWDKPARDVSGLTAAIELARVLRELKGEPTRCVLQKPPEPRITRIWGV